MRLVIALLLASLAAGCDKEKAGGSQPAPTEAANTPATEQGKVDRSFAGRPAPDAEFKDPDQQMTSLAAFSGKPLLVNLWATWCGPCVAEMPTLDKLAAAGGDLQVLAVSQDVQGQEEKVAAFFKERQLANLEAYQDPNLLLMEKLEAAVLPTTVLYDSAGKEIWRVVGAFDWTGDEAKKLLSEAR